MKKIVTYALALVMLLSFGTSLAAETDYMDFYAQYQARFGEDERFWTVEEAWQFNVAEVECGYSTQLTHILPDENEIDQQSAEALARETIVSTADPECFGGWSVEDYERCTAVSFSYLAADDEEDGPYWQITFYQPDDRWSYPEDYTPALISGFVVYISGYGANVQVIYNDPYSMDSIYLAGRGMNNFTPSSEWPEEEREELYERLMAVYDRELIRRGEIREGYAAFLEQMAQ